MPKKPSLAPPASSDTKALAPEGLLLADLDISYEDALSELERLVAKIEAGDLALDQVLGEYQRGVQLLNLCRQRLTVVEDQVKVLEEGQLRAWRGPAA